MFSVPALPWQANGAMNERTNEKQKYWHLKKCCKNS